MIALSLLFGVSVFAGDKEIKTDTSFACKSRQQVKILVDYNEKHNRFMFERTLDEGLKSGDIIPLRSGDNVYIVEKHESGLVKIRVEGFGAGEYWTDLKKGGKQ